MKKKKRARNDGRVHFGFRVTPEFKMRMENAAGKTGRSQSQEAEIRLERSFEREDLLFDALTLAYGRQTAGLILIIGRSVNWTARLAGFMSVGDDEGAANWLAKPFAFRQVEDSIAMVLAALRPDGETDALPAINKMGERESAEILLELIGEKEPSDPVWVERVRGLLGQAAIDKLRDDPVHVDLLKRRATMLASQKT